MVNYLDLFSYKWYYEVNKKIISRQFTHQTTLKVAPPFTGNLCSLLAVFLLTQNRLLVMNTHVTMIGLHKVHAGSDTLLNRRLYIFLLLISDHICKTSTQKWPNVF